MSIFSDIFSLIGGFGQKKAIGNATQAQVTGATNGINTINTEDQRIQGLLAPYTTAGGQAVGAEGGLLGLNGSGDQQRAIDALRSSPLYQSLYRNGVNTSLANASATGGLRGGNEQHSLYDVGSDTLAQVIQNQLQNLGGLSGQGLQATQQSGSFGGQAAGDVASLQNLIGRIQAGGILGKSAVNGQLWNTGANLGQDIISQLMSAFGGGGNPFGGGGNGSDLMSSLGQMQGSNAALFGG